MEFKHKSVLLEETIDNLNIKPDGIYVDGTLGGAGHSYQIAKRLTGGGRLIGIDQDADAIAAATERLKEFEERVTIVRNNYCNMDKVLDELGIDKVDGILLDIGVSSYQLDTASRGFTYNVDTALDMRMDQRQEMTAKDLVNTYSEMELFRIIRDYGEDRFAKNIAKHIVAARKEKPIETTFELNEIIKASIPAKVRATGGHPSKRTYQAIRIELNRELDVLENSIDMMIDRLNPQGRLCIITFHSLEDRIVKARFRNNENPCTCPPDFPVCVCGKKSKGKVITRKPIVPGDEELNENQRSKSSKLRVFEGKVLEKRRNVVNHRTTEYQYGSAVRKLQTVPEVHTYEHERRIEEQEQERRQRRREIRRNNRVNLVYTTVLAICATAVFAICYQYLNLQSDIKTNSTAVVELQNQLNSLKAENNSHESEINAGIDYNAIYDTAVNELGMVYPSRSQVIGYDSKESEYVKQYKDISK